MTSLSRRMVSWNPRRHSKPEKEEEELTKERKLDKITVSSNMPAAAPVKKQERDYHPLFVSEDDNDDDDECNVPPKPKSQASQMVENFEHHLEQAIQFAERDHSIIKVDCNEAQGWGKRTMCWAPPGGSFDDSSVVTATKAAEPLFIKVPKGDPVILQQRSWDIVRENSMTDDYKKKTKGRSMKPKVVEIVHEHPDLAILDEGDWEGMKSAVESRKKKQASTKSEKKNKKKKFLSSLRRIIRGKKETSIREAFSQCTAPIPSIDEEDNETVIMESPSLEVVYTNGGDCLIHSDIHREQVIY
jgi:hypothetical protein